MWSRSRYRRSRRRRWTKLTARALPQCSGRGPRNLLTEDFSYPLSISFFRPCGGRRDTSCMLRCDGGGDRRRLLVPRSISCRPLVILSKSERFQAPDNTILTLYCSLSRDETVAVSHYETTVRYDRAEVQRPRRQPRSGLLPRHGQAGRPRRQLPCIPAMWMPSPRKVFCSALIRSLALMRSVCARAHERWPRWFPRREFQTDKRPHRGPPGNAVFLSSGSIDHTICSSCKFRHRLSTVAVKLLPVSD